MRRSLKIIGLLSIGLLLLLLFRNVLQLDLAATKNDSLTRQTQQEIMTIESVDSLKSKAFQLLTANRQQHRNRSNHATFELMVLAVLLIFQLILLRGKFVSKSIRN